MIKHFVSLFCALALVLVFSTSGMYGCAAAGYTKVVEPAITGVESARRSQFRKLNVTISNPYTRPIWVSLVCCPAGLECPGETTVREKVYIKSRSDKTVSIFPDVSQGAVTCYIEPY